MEDSIDIAINQQQAEEGGVKVELNGKSFAINDAIEELRKIVTNNVEPFDSTRPRLIEPVVIHIGGKDRHLRLPFWALRRFQKETGVSPWDHEKVWSIPADLDLTVALLWAAMLDEAPELTLDEVWMFEGLDFANIHYIRKCLDDCWGRNMPDPDKASAGGSNPNRGGRRQNG
jgi:hypothetical protein